MLVKIGNEVKTKMKITWRQRCRGPCEQRPTRTGCIASESRAKPSCEYREPSRLVIRQRERGEKVRC